MYLYIIYFYLKNDKFVKLIVFSIFFKVCPILARNSHGLGWASKKLTRIKIDQINLAHIDP